LLIPTDFPRTGRCAQCGKASTVDVIRVGIDDLYHMTEWCDTHAPDVWQLVERRRKTAEKMRRAAEARRWQRSA
jgi:hypothetical protein